MLTSAFIGILIPFAGTTIGSACVFFMKKSLHPKIQRLSLSNTYKIPYLYAQAALCAQMTLIHNVKKGDTLISLKLSFIALPPQPAQPRHPCGTRKLLLSAAPFLT